MATMPRETRVARWQRTHGQLLQGEDVIEINVIADVIAHRHWLFECWIRFVVIFLIKSYSVLLLKSCIYIIAIQLDSGKTRLSIINDNYADASAIKYHGCYKVAISRHNATNRNCVIRSSVTRESFCFRLFEIFKYWKNKLMFTLILLVLEIICCIYRFKFVNREKRYLFQ